ncbi:MAG: T9SS type A sorting domain-containing protein [Bacteroidota bacterium]
MMKVIPAILLLFFYTGILKSQTTNGRIQIVNENSGKILCNVQVNLEDDSSNIGNFVNRINYDSNAISFPNEPQASVDYWFHESEGAKYFSSVTKPTEGTVSINVAHLSGIGHPIGSNYIDIASLKFNTISQFNSDNMQFGLRQFFAPYSSKMWKNGTWSISSLGEEYVPLLISPFNNEIKSSNSVVFSWQKIEDASKYHLEIALDATFEKIVYSIDDITGNEIIVKDIVNGSRYYWRVRSFKQETPSHYSKNSSFVITVFKPDEIVASSYNDQFVQLNWQNNSTTAQYIVVERMAANLENDGFVVIDTIDANRTTYLDSNIESDITYTYRIHAINRDSFSEYSDSASILMSVKDIEAAENLPKDFKLQQNYPNPFNPQTTISYAVKEDSNIKIIVYSLLGEKIATLIDESQNAGKYEIIWNAGNYPSGIYVYIMTAESTVTDHTFQNVKKMILLK